MKSESERGRGRQGGQYAAAAGIERGMILRGWIVN